MERWGGDTGATGMWQWGIEATIFCRNLPLDRMESTGSLALSMSL